MCRAVSVQTNSTGEPTVAYVKNTQQIFRKIIQNVRAEDKNLQKKLMRKKHKTE
jgi:hypothetical protein